MKNQAVMGISKMTKQPNLNHAKSNKPNHHNRPHKTERRR